MEPSHLRRHTQRGTYDIDSVRAVFEDCFTAHVAYIDNGLPVCMPMIALVREEELDHDDDCQSGRDDTDEGSREERKVVAYLHGHPSTRLMELVRDASRSNCSAERIKMTVPVKVCITATKIDGLVLSSAPNGHTFNYRSAVIHGTCTPVHSKQLKRKVMHDVTNHILTNRWEEVNPVSSFQVSLVYVVQVNIDSMSVKSRTGLPGIQPRNPEVDGPDIETQPWTGVVPLWEQLGEPVASGLTPSAHLPGSLPQYIQERNQRHKRYSETVAK